MQYFYMGSCAMVLRIFGIYLRFFWARKIEVALEHKILKWVSEGEMNIFLLWKILIWLFWGFDQRNREDKSLGWNPRICPSDKPIWKDSNSKSNQGKNHDKNQVRKRERRQVRKKREGKIQAVTNLPHLRWISSSRFGCLGKPVWYAVLKNSSLSQVASSSVWCSHWTL